MHLSCIEIPLTVDFAKRFIREIFSSLTKLRTIFIVILKSRMIWRIGKRFEFIEFRVFRMKSIKYVDIVDFSGASMQQSLRNLTAYQEFVPVSVTHDKYYKNYTATDFYIYIAPLRSLTGGAVLYNATRSAVFFNADIALPPEGDVDVKFLYEFLGTSGENVSVDIFCRSIEKMRLDPIWLRVRLQSVGYDGFRWHTRADCNIEHKFKYFLLLCILGARGECNLIATGLIIESHPDLKDSQKKVVAKGYRRHSGNDVRSVRCAVLFYVVKRLGLLGDAAKQSAPKRYVFVLSRRETEPALNKAECQI